MIKTFRVLESLMISLLSVVPAILSAGEPLVFLPFFFGLMGASGLNEYFGAESDKLYRQDKSIPAGKLDKNTTIKLSFGLLLVSLALSINYDILYPIFLIEAVLVLYATHIRWSWKFLGQFISAIAIASFVLVVSTHSISFAIFWFVLLLILSYFLLSELAHPYSVEQNTLRQIIGEKRTKMVAQLMLVLMSIWGFLPLIYGDVSYAFYFSFSFAMICFSLYFSIIDRFKYAKRILKAVLFMFLLACLSMLV
ncbi:MAG: hypothetical protein GOU99_02315 [Candidatus Altiarchaeota archaeon]|nr:hypothetical protein [Candidatus Altiarchaeota archaeon]